VTTDAGGQRLLFWKEVSPCFRPFCIGKLSDKCLPIRTLLYNSFKHILISLTSFMGTPNSIRILYNTSLLTMLGGSLVTTAWHILRLWMEDMPSSFGGQLRIYWTSSRGQPTRGGPPA
jgi:hypothetical protein